MENSCKALIIGGSAGSLEVLLKVLPSFHSAIAFPIIIVIHRKQGRDSLLTTILASKTTLKVKEAEEKETLRDGCVYIAPSDYHLLIENDFSFSLDCSEKVNYSRPSIDVTFQSAAEVFQKNLVCLLLSGSNSDGVNGLKTVKDYNGIVLVQDPAEAQVSYMPAQAVQKVKVDRILAIDEIATFINQLNR